MSRYFARVCPKCRGVAIGVAFLPVAFAFIFTGRTPGAICAWPCYLNKFSGRNRARNFKSNQAAIGFESLKVVGCALKANAATHFNRQPKSVSLTQPVAGVNRASSHAVSWEDRGKKFDDGPKSQITEAQNETRRFQVGAVSPILTWRATAWSPQRGPGFFTDFFLSGENRYHH
jgi:hypothetical protein